MNFQFLFSSFNFDLYSVKILKTKTDEINYSKIGSGCLKLPISAQIVGTKVPPITCCGTIDVGHGSKYTYDNYISLHRFW